MPETKNILSDFYVQFRCCNCVSVGEKINTVCEVRLSLNSANFLPTCSIPELYRL